MTAEQLLQRIHPEDMGLSSDLYPVALRDEDGTPITMVKKAKGRFLRVDFRHQGGPVCKRCRV